jgi:hypothetical protein
MRYKKSLYILLAIESIALFYILLRFFINGDHYEYKIFILPLTVILIITSTFIRKIR